MASRRVGLYKYTSIDGRWRYLKAVFYPNNKIKAHAVLDKGIERVAKGGQYVLSYARVKGGVKPVHCGGVKVGQQIVGWLLCDCGVEGPLERSGSGPSTPRRVWE